jgi:hypothetical protein
MKWGLLALLVAGAGCHALFTDERGASSQEGGGAVGNADLGPGTELGSGRFVGRAGHVASGTVTLIDHSGTLEIQLGDDFGVSDVPGPVLVLSPRDSLGTAIDPVAGDLEVATLASPQGAQAYMMPLAGTAPPNVFVFCKPYGLEVGKAQVLDAP